MDQAAFYSPYWKDFQQSPISHLKWLNLLSQLVTTAASEGAPALLTRDQTPPQAPSHEGTCPVFREFLSTPHINQEHFGTSDAPSILYPSLCSNTFRKQLSPNPSDTGFSTAWIAAEHRLLRAFPFSPALNTALVFWKMSPCSHVGATQVPITFSSRPDSGRAHRPARHSACAAWDRVGSLGMKFMWATYCSNENKKSCRRYIYLYAWIFNFFPENYQCSDWKSRSWVARMWAKDLQYLHPAWLMPFLCKKSHLPSPKTLFCCKKKHSPQNRAL